ncbi:unnamed protein product [Urochloa decumbens]|uniref:Uncharacterized protein n=1 Tax=Urochloa decumbens TaxID=240449 RepID=A0ABC9C0R0_9POAL
MSGGGGRKAAGPSGEEAEVEALLRAAQDAVMLKLQANSHLISSTSASVPAPAAPLDGAAAEADPLEDDLARRFNALKSRAAAPKPASAGAGAPAGGGGMDELEARFAALKGATAGGSEKEARVRLEDLGGESSEDEESEVDKVMRWAMDAARLEVATAGALAGDKGKRADVEEEEEKDEKSSVSSDEDDDEEERLQMEMARKRKEMAKNKTKSKWFFL